jgi:hypothetical protein
MENIFPISVNGKVVTPLKSSRSLHRSIIFLTSYAIIDLFHYSVSTQNIQRQEVRRLLNNEFEINGHDVTEALSQNFS